MSKNLQLKTHNYTATETIQISTNLTCTLNLHDKKIQVLDGSNLLKTGIITINNEKIKYQKHNLHELKILKRGIQNTSIKLTHIIGSIITQEINSLNNENTGWISDKNGDVTLKLNSGSVIAPGVIRFLKDDENEQNSVFQGCISISENQETGLIEPVWQNFSSLKGDKGDKGDNANKLLKFVNSGLGEGKLVINKEINSDTDDVKFRSLKSGLITVNGQSKPSINISTVNNDIILNPEPQEYTPDLTMSLSKIMGNPKSDQVLNTNGNTVIIRAANKINKGQVVMLTNLSYNNETYLGIEPFLLNNYEENQFLNTGINPLNYNKNSSLIYGIACQDGEKGDKIKVLKDGIGFIKIGNNILIDENGNRVTIKYNIDYIGENVYLDSQGYGYVTSNILELPDPHVIIGQALETGVDKSKTNNYLLINVNLKKNEL